MSYRVFHFLFGYVLIRVSEIEPERVINLFLNQKIRFWGIRRLEDGSVSFFVNRAQKARAHALCDELCKRFSAECEITEFGLPVYLNRYRRRTGLYLGVFAGIFFTFLSTFFVWGVTIDTNSEIFSQSELYGFLSDFGIRPGILKSKLDEKELPTRFILEHPEFVFASFNVEGLRLNVELMQRAQVPKQETTPGTCHLVAQIGGIIESCEVYCGEPMVKAGDVVNAGDLLVSGAMTLRAGGYRLVESRAVILAQTHREFTVKIPFSQTITVPSGREKSRSSLEILGVTLSPLFNWDSFENSVCLYEQTPLEFFGAELPVLRKTKTEIELLETSTEYSEEEAKEVAVDRYREWLHSILGERGTLLSEELAFAVEEDGVLLSCEVSLVENVVKVSPFDFTQISVGENGNIQEDES